nr:MAG TPA: hypothetical protein [Caudoviricetes sp.]
MGCFFNFEVSSSRSIAASAHCWPRDIPPCPRAKA